MKRLFAQRQLLFVLAAGLATALFFQNCAQPKMAFNEAVDTSQGVGGKNPPVDDGPEDDGPVHCLNFNPNIMNEDCSLKEFGLRGILYYLYDKSDGARQAAYLYDKNDQPIPFTPAGISSVNVIIDRGYQVEGRVLLSDMSLPATSFTEGFKTGANEYLSDVSGKKLFEGFALDLKSNLILPAGMDPGLYEVTLVSDDGSLLDMDLDGDGHLERVVENDGFHSVQMACSTVVLDLKANSSIPMRVRYFQGPRQTIALGMALRKIQSASDAGKDPNCHLVTSVDSAGNVSVQRVSSAGNFSLASLQQRGWIIPGEQMFKIK